MEQDRRLVGVGLGPGDPELLTCKAVRLLNEADVVLVASQPGTEPGRAELTVLAHLADASRLRRVEPGLTDSGVPRECWECVAAAALEAFEQGARVVAFATLGDPSVYSIFGFAAQAVREADAQVGVEVVPGITAMQALAAASATPLVEGTESLTLVPATAGLATFTDALEHSDTVVAYKGGRYLAAMRGELSLRGRLEGAVLGEDVSLDGETITLLSDLPVGRRTDLPSTVIVPAARGPR